MTDATYISLGLPCKIYHHVGRQVDSDIQLQPNIRRVGTIRCTKRKIKQMRQIEHVTDSYIQYKERKGSE